MEAFSKKSQEFREVCYQLTGYKIDFHYTNQYKVTSMYAETRDDFFIFQVMPHVLFGCVGYKTFPSGKMEVGSYNAKL